MTYCPCCRDLYDPGIELDGTFFGPSFPHFFVQAVNLRVPFEPHVPTPLSVFGIPVAKSNHRIGLNQIDYGALFLVAVKSTGCSSHSLASQCP
jgi:hypothetical protein